MSVDLRPSYNLSMLIHIHFSGSSKRPIFASRAIVMNNDVERGNNMEMHNKNPSTTESKTLVHY